MLPVADMRALLSLYEGVRVFDKDIASALVRLCAASGELEEARLRLGAMCAARHPPTPPGAALLAIFVSACGLHPHGPVEGVAAFETLSTDGPLACRKHAEIWSALVPACSEQRRADLGLVLAKRLQAGGHPIDGQAAVALFRALEKQGFAEGAFTMDSHRLDPPACMCSPRRALAWTLHATACMCSPRRALPRPQAHLRCVRSWSIKESVSPLPLRRRPAAAAPPLPRRRG